MARRPAPWRTPRRVAADFITSINGPRRHDRDATDRAVVKSEERARRAQALADASQRFAEDGLDVPGVLDAVARLTGEVLGDLSVVRLLADDRRRLLPGSVWHTDPDALAQARAALSSEGEAQALGFSRQVLDTGTPLRIADVTRDDLIAISPVHRSYVERHGLHSILLVPLQARGRGIGILSVSRETPGRPYTADDLSFLEDLANRAAIAIDNARLYDALRLSEEHYHALVTATTSLTWTAGADGAFVTEQPAWEAFTGQPWETHAGWGWLEALHPEDRAAKRVDRERAIAERGMYVSEGRIWHAASGDYHACITRALPLFHPDGSIREWIGSVTDVHEQQQVEQALVASEERYRQLANTVPSIVWTAAPDGVITYASDRWFEYCGITFEENVRRWPEFVLHPDDRERCLAAWASALREGHDYTIEVRNRRHDGEYRWFLTQAVPVRDTAGQITAWFGATTDIHASKEADAALALSEERLRLALEAGGMGTWDWDPGSGQIIWSDEVEALFGLTAGSFDGSFETYLDLLHPDDRSQVAATIARAAAEGGDFTVEHRVTLPDGAVHWLAGRGRSYLNHDGALERMAGTVMDVTERKEVERLQREFLGLVTHELKGPLTSLKGFAQLMRRRGTYNADGLDTIIRQSSHLERLIDDLLDAVRLEAGRLDLRPATVDLIALVRSCVEQARATTSTHRIALTTPDTTLEGSWDPDRLEQIILNLLSNAIKYSPEGGVIEVTVNALDGEAMMQVADHGIGIPADDIPRLFDRFYRVSETRGYSQGLGLGLYITKTLVEAHGGRIDVDSMPGDGSTFVVRLPLTAPAVVAVRGRLRAALP